MWLKSCDKRGCLCLSVLVLHVWVCTQCLPKGLCVNAVDISEIERWWICTCLQLNILWVGWLLHWTATVKYILMWRKVAIDFNCLHMCACVSVCVGSYRVPPVRGCCMMFKRERWGRFDGQLCGNLMSVLKICPNDNGLLSAQTKLTW